VRWTGQYIKGVSKTGLDALSAEIHFFDVDDEDLERLEDEVG
jgi:hypothetical protein